MPALSTTALADILIVDQSEADNDDDGDEQSGASADGLMQSEAEYENPMLRIVKADKQTGIVASLLAKGIKSIKWYVVYS